MPYCVPIEPIPFVRYTGFNQEEVDQFLLTHGGTKARYKPDGQADIPTLVKGELRFIYCNPGSYIRLMTTGQFNAMSSRLFRDNYRIIDPTELSKPKPDHANPEATT